MPLPYPLEPIEDELPPWQEQVRDPKSVHGYFELLQGSQLREMELPNFHNPPDTLGYSGEPTFAVPAALVRRVDFWKKIYTHFTNSQAVLHDSDYPEIIYEVVDISRFTSDNTLSPRRRIKLLQRFLKAEKEKIVQKLLELHSSASMPHTIRLELFSIFKLFERVNEPNKFLMATQRVRAQTGQRDGIVQGFLYGGRYFSKMMEIFEKKKIPKELTRLPLVESAFNLAARSKVGASGIWQFMRSTGKRFLRIDRAVDERNDPIAATWAAAELLRQNYEILGTWPLAITAYNHGREGMAKAVRVLATTDLVEIIRRYRSKTFGFASSNFYAEFLAILEVEREYKKYFGKLLVDSPLRFEEFALPEDAKFEALALACSLSERELAILNSALTDAVIAGRIPVPRGYLLRVPSDKLQPCKAGYRNVAS